MKISKLEPSKRKKGRFLIHLESGDILRVGENEMADFALYTGLELSEAQLAALRAASRERALREKALNALTDRPMSRKELTDRLKLLEAGQEEAEGVADWLEGLGLLNDEEYAKSLVRHYAAKGYGPYKLRDELYRRGIPKPYWEDALQEAEDPAEIIDALLWRRLGGGVVDQKALKRASDALARRGYSWGDIHAGLRRYGAEIEEE